MTAVKKPGVGYLMPSSYVQPGTTSYVEMAAPSPPTLFTAPITTAGNFFSFSSDYDDKTTIHISKINSAKCHRKWVIN